MGGCTASGNVGTNVGAPFVDAIQKALPDRFVFQGVEPYPADIVGHSLSLAFFFAQLMAIAGWIPHRRLKSGCEKHGQPDRQGGEQMPRCRHCLGGYSQGGQVTPPSCGSALGQSVWQDQGHCSFRRPIKREFRLMEFIQKADALISAGPCVPGTLNDHVKSYWPPEDMIC